MPAADTLDDPLAVTAYDVLNHAADQFTKGKARGGYDWHKAGVPVDQHTAGDNCIMLAIVIASRECGAYMLAYDSIICVQRYLGALLGDWNDEKGRTVGEVVDALRGAALFS